MKSKSLIKYFIVLAVFFAFSNNAYAIDEIEQNSVLSINDCIELALKNSPTIQIYKEQIEIRIKSITKDINEIKIFFFRVF